MPELPEVETVRRQLNEVLVGATIVSIDLLKTGREKPIGEDFVKALIGKKIKQIKRRAKLLIWQFTDQTSMVGHLKMTGCFSILPKDYEPNKHDRMKFIFDNLLDKCVVWQDIRTFGYVHLVNKDELSQILSKYGPEPLVTSTKKLAECFITPPKRTIKSALLNQEVVAGVGNIYADEVCFASQVRPNRQLKDLTHKERLLIAKNIQDILQMAIKNNGTTIVNYVNSVGGKGEFVNFLKVYGKKGEACLKCTGLIEKIVMNGRGTHFCPKCQK